MAGGLSRIFYHLGVSIATYPFIYIFSTCLLSLFSVGLIRMNLEDRVRDGYTPLNSESHKETTIYKEFVGTKGEPLFTVVIVRAKDNGSLIRPQHLEAVVNLSRLVMDEFNFTVEGKTMTYKDLCGDYCQYNEVVKLFKEALEQQRQLASEKQDLLLDTDLKFPLAKVHGISISLYRHFHLVQSYTNLNLSAPLPTSIKSVRLMLLIFRSDKSPEKFINEKDVLSIWENSIYQYVLNEFSSPYIRADVVGTEVLNTEIIRGGKATVPFFAVGFAIMAVFVLVSQLGSADYYGQLDGGKFLVAIGTLISPLLAVSTTLGFTSLLGLRINSMTLVAPFLVMAIGVDDAFLMIHSWQRLSQSHKGTIVEKLGSVLEQVGPSITITSITNTLAFGIGAFTPTPEIQLFCRTTALAMAMDFVFELTFFAPILALAVRFEKKDHNQPVPVPVSRKEELKRKIRTLFSQSIKGYSRFLANPLTALAVVALCACFWFFAILGAVRIQPLLDGQKLLPKDSPLLEADRLLTENVWSEHHPVSVLINKELNISNETEYKLFKGMVREFESLDRAVGPVSTMLWLNDYEYYYKTLAPMIENALVGFIDDFFEEEENDDEQDIMTYEKVEEFLNMPQYKHYSGDIKWEKINGTTKVHRFIFSTVYRNTSEWRAKVELMLRWREIAAKYHTLWNVTVWEASSHFIDQILSLKTVTANSVLITLTCMGAVCMLFIPSPCSVLCASLAIASISLGVFGFLSWWGMDLDPVTMSATLMSIGLSVDFTAHVSYHYRDTGHMTVNGQAMNKAERLLHTFDAVAFPMFQAGFSTLFCVLPLSLLQSYPPDVFVKTIILVVLWGWLHGLLILPAVLAALPSCATGTGCDKSHTRKWNIEIEEEEETPNLANNETIELEKLKIDPICDI